MSALLQLVGPAMAYHLWWWTTFMFEPTVRLRRLGLPAPKGTGNLPTTVPESAPQGPELSLRYRRPVLLPSEPANYDTVRSFDDLAAIYESVVRPFSTHVFNAAMDLAAPLLPATPRVLDPSAGPGHEAVLLAKRYPKGEVIAADLSRGMVEQAYGAASKAGVTNMAFFQADVVAPPEELHGYFDAVFCCLAFHHYPDGEGAVRAFRRVLRPGGRVIVADGGPAWFVALARPISKLADPGFVRHRTGDEFRALFSGAGFSSVYWIEALPGIGVTIATV